MRISGGQYKNRKIEAPDTPKTRPTTDEIREAIFNILGPIEDFKILDCYAGSGAIGLEALSRGAARVVAVEKSPAAAAAIRSNVEHLNLSEQYELHQQSVEDWLKRQGNAKGEYDLIFTDPPFAKVSAEAINNLVGWLQPKGLLIVRTKYKLPLVEVAGMEIIKSRRYGESIVSFYRFSKPS